jgi:hypothetical protein
MWTKLVGIMNYDSTLVWWASAFRGVSLTFSFDRCHWVIFSEKQPTCDPGPALQLTLMMTASHFGVGQTWGPNSRTSTNFGDLKEYHPIIHPIKKWRNCPAMLASTQRVQTHDPPKKWKQWPLNSDQSSGFRIPKWTDRIRRPVGPPTTGFLESLPAARRCPARPDLRGTWGTGRDSEPQWRMR